MHELLLVLITNNWSESVVSLIQLDQYLLSGELIDLERSYDSEDRLQGYVVGLSGRLVVLMVFIDLRFDGFHVFSLSDIERCTCSETERFCDFMLRSEGVVEMDRVDAGIPLHSFAEAAVGIQNKYGKLIVETEGPGNPGCEFAIGSLVDVRDGVMRFDGFDVNGEWYEDATEIACEDITRLQYKTPYINIYSKYLKGTPASALEQ